MFEFVPNAFLGVGAGKFSGAKLASGEVKGGEANYPRADGSITAGHACDGGEKIVFIGTEGRIGGGSGSQDASDFATDDLLRDFRVFHLLADGDLEPLANQLGDVAFGGVIGHATHGDGDPFFLIARGQRDLKFARRDDGVLEEEFVEVPKPKKEQCVGMVLLDGSVLPHQGSAGFGLLRMRRVGHDGSCADYSNRRRVEIT